MKLIPETGEDETRIATGREVSCRILEIFFHALAEKNLPPHTLTTGVAYSLEYLQNKKKRIDWNSFCLIMENASQVWSDEELVALAGTLINSPWVKPFAMIAKIFVSAKDIYRYGGQPRTGAFNQLFNVANGVVTEIGPNNIMSEYTMHPGYKKSPQFGLIGMGVQKALPRLLGLPDATIKMEEFENGFRYMIWLPENEINMFTRLWKMVMWPFTVRSVMFELNEAYVALQEQNLDMEKEIIARKEAEESLRKSEQRFRSIVSTSQEWIWAADANGVLTFSNQAIENILGYQHEELVGQRIVDSFMYEEDIPKFSELLNQCIEQKKGWTNDIARWKHKNGSLRYLESCAVPIFDSSGNLQGFQGSDRDITERQRAEEAIKKSRERYRTIFESTATANAIIAEDTTIVMANNDFAEWSGYTKQEIEGKMKWTVFIHEDDLERVMGYHRMRRLNSASIPSYYEFRGVSRKGEIRNFYINVATIPDTRERIISLTDLTEKKRLENQLVQAQKMESIGRLAGGVAHDFNNMLSVIIGNTEIALRKIQKSDPLYKTLHEIHNAGMRSSDLTRQLLVFARKQAISPKVMDLNETISNTLKILRRIIGEDINLILRPDPSLWKVKIDPSQIDQILTNTIVNARDAIAKTGQIIIETSNVNCDETYCEDKQGCIPGEYVMLAVSDNGCGMNKETMANVFEPFFTTKKEGQGTGLGLATVYGIIKQNNGFINVYSEPKHGTTFRIYLPRYSGEGMELPKHEAENEAKGGSETILLVEDDMAVLNLSQAVLEMLGYKILAANRTDQAIRLAEEYDGNIDLLLTDVIMPDMNGKDLSERIITIKPGLKCLYMSGYTADIITRQGVLGEGINFIAKPFSLKGLAIKVREVLNS